MRFVKFRPDNFTSHVRTPWAGRRIARTIKSQLGLNLPSCIGESWEFSTSSELPSTCVGEVQGSFSDFLKQPENAARWLSPLHSSVWHSNSPLLVKYIDAASDLSLQLHPPIEAPELPEDHSGKWESWVILGHEPNAGIYLGFEPGVTRERFVDAIQSGSDIRSLLHFIPVKLGEMYAIPPCTVHALGAGICVLEPQLMQPGKKAISLRLHDWNRRYDCAGMLDDNGTPRELHLEQALPYIDFVAQNGCELEARCRIKPQIICENEGLRVLDYSQPPFLMARLLSGSGVFSGNHFGELTFLAAMHGSVELDIDGEVHLLRKGESGVIAASAQKFVVKCRNARIYVAHCLPACYSDCAVGRL